MAWISKTTEKKAGRGHHHDPKAPALALASPRDKNREASLYDVKTRVHHRLVERLDLGQLEALEESLVAEEIRKAVGILLAEETVPLSREERTRLAQELEYEILGLGPLELLVRDHTVSDILVNRFDQVYIERRGRLERTEVRFQDNAHLLKIINKIVSNMGRRIDESSPMVDARLPDGSRVNAIIPPLALDGPMLSIRRFAVHRPTLEELIEKGSMTPEIGDVLRSMVKAKLNILISGGTGSGKTTTLNALSRFIPEDERIITIEDTAELQLQQRHVVKFETRPPNLNKEGGINQRQLVRTALRMRPDRIIVGECRGGEALDMLQAMNTGVEGSMTTIHANSPRDAFSRLEAMVLMSDVEMPSKVILQQVSSAIKMVVQVSRLQDGSRKIIAISEVLGVQNDRVEVHDIFFFERMGVTPDGKVQGRFRWSGTTPKILQRIKVAGIPFDENVFNEVMEVNL